MTPYYYCLLTSKSEIRVLRVLPGTDDELPCGTLIHVDLDAHPFYKTLSYTWGESDLCCHINLDGNELAITSNLDSALRKLRSGHAVVELWADTICLNQKWNLERSQQVILMRRIYSEYEECMIYMGEESDNSDIVPEFLTTPYQGFIDLYYYEGFRPGDNIFSLSHDLVYSIPSKEDPGWLAF